MIYRTCSADDEGKRRIDMIYSFLMRLPTTFNREREFWPTLAVRTISDGIVIDAFLLEVDTEAACRGAFVIHDLFHSQALQSRLCFNDLA